jgi:5-methylcytosine-specific restriction endonuclease McrA
MIRQCVICSKEFNAIPARVNAKLCSNACRYIYQGRTRKAEGNGRWLGEERERRCQQCGEPFRYYSRSRKFCSLACTKLGQKRYYGLEHPRSNPASRARGAQSNSKIQQRWAAQVFLQDDVTCQQCGISGVKMHAHHVLPWKEFPEHRADVWNGVTLCVKCHRGVHSNDGKIG